jgi:hypothetical protein
MEEVEGQPPFVVFLEPLFLRGFWSSEVTQPLGNHGATAISEDVHMSLGPGVISSPLEVKKAVRALSGILIVLNQIVFPLILVFMSNWPVMRDPQTHESDLSVVYYQIIGGGAVFPLGIKEIGISLGGLDDLGNGEVEICELNFLPGVWERDDGFVNNGRCRWPPDRSVCAGHGGYT